MCSLSQHRYKQIYWNFKRYQTSNRRRTENQQQGIPPEEIEGIYEVIDESNMIYNLGDLRNDNMSVQDTNGSYVQPDSNDYLTPYHPVDDDAKTNNSKDNESESTAYSDSYNRPTSNHESSSSSSDVQGRRSSYLNPYQSIVQSVDIHEYLSIHNIDDSVSSGSIELTRESVFLNPVQPMIQVSSVLDNKYAIGCLDVLGSSLTDTRSEEIGVKCQYPYIDVTSEKEPLEYKSVTGISSDTVPTNLDTAGKDSVERKLDVYGASSNEI